MIYFLKIAMQRFYFHWHYGFNILNYIFNSNTMNSN